MPPEEPQVSKSGPEALFSSLCTEAFGVRPLAFEPMAGGGGDRRYWRAVLTEAPGVPATAVCAQADNAAEARAFIGLARVFAKHGIPVPRIYASAPDAMLYVMEDLGNVTLLDAVLGSAPGSPDVESLYAQALEALATMQTLPEGEWHREPAFPPLDRRQVMWDLNYFKYEFLKPAGVAFDEVRLEDDFESLASSILSLESGFWGFMMRDCQGRNVMLHQGPFFIDFQGGRKGLCPYDAVSLLWQAKAGLDSSFRKRMAGVYARAFAARRGVSSGAVLRTVPLLALFRTLQVLGAYGFRGLVQRRAHFIESIPGALENLKELLGEGVADPWPELKEACLALVSLPAFAPAEKSGKLRVQVFSFSYKRGYPDDFSGNGGGFMFDCRAMHNPGRYPEYRHLTGRDEAVASFLRERGEAGAFAEKAVEMVAPAVERYLARGFTSLQVGFGCTGGQHRSVYCAENTARRLAAMFPAAEIILTHREQGIEERIPPEPILKSQDSILTT